MGYLRRLATTGAAYTASSVLAKLIAVALLPVYTRFLDPSDYGAAEVLLVSVVAASIVVRLGVIEAVLRFVYLPDLDRDAVIRTAFASLLATVTVAAIVLGLVAEPLSRVVLGHSDAVLMRIAVGGLWVFTLYELVLVLFRIDERARDYFAVTSINVLTTVALTVTLVVGAGLNAEGLLLGNFGASALVLAVLLVVWRRRFALVPDRGLLRRMVRYGLPTMPAELSLYALTFADRILLARLSGLVEAGLYSLALKFAQGVTLLVRGFQLAWPPLAYSITDDDEARGAYALIVTWFTAVCAGAVLALSLLAPWLVRLLAAPDFFKAWEAIPLLTTGVTLYALYLVLVVAVQRTGRTEYAFPVAGAAAVVNIGLNVVLIPPLGIVGAGLALVLGYLVMLGLMYGVVRRLFALPLQWLRLARVVLSAGALAALGIAVVPLDGLAPLAARLGLIAAYPALLWLSGFLAPAERRWLATNLRPSAVAGRLRTLRATAPAGEPADATAGGATPEPSPDRAAAAAVFEQELRDEDRAGEV